MGDSAEGLRASEDIYYPMVHPAINPVFWRKVKCIAKLLRWPMLPAVTKDLKLKPKAINQNLSNITTV
jgi:hypothetical protein